MSEKYLLKDILLNPQKTEKIAKEIEAIFPAFNSDEFITTTINAFPTLELKERIYHIRDRLHYYLPNDYLLAVKLLLKALPRPLDDTLKDNDFGDFIYAPYSEYITKYGCSKEYLEVSLSALREITKRFSVEFAIRDFINLFPAKTLEMLKECSLSNNYHERRLASECLRPKLPWAKKLTIDYTVSLEILDKLFYDNTRYVTRSVANHLNDIAKINPDTVLTRLIAWEKSKKQIPKEMDYIIRHSLRTLVKNGNTQALSLLGYSADPDILVQNICIGNNHLNVGDSLALSCELYAKENVNLMVDYILHFQTKSGGLSPKVHKLKKISLKNNDKISLSKKHLFRPNMSTRKLYTGLHKVAFQINGKVFDSIDFHLEVINVNPS